MPYYSQAYLRAHPELKSSAISLGTDPTTGDELLIPDGDRYAGMYTLGVPGMGKSGFMETLIHQDAMAGNGMMIVDPHGDQIEHVLAALPQHRIAQTFYLDLEDVKYPYGINPFAEFKAGDEVERTQAAAQMEHLFETLFEGAMDQQFLPRFVRAVTFTLLDNPGSTLVDVLTLLKRPEFRARMVANVREADIREFWRDEFDGTEDHKISDSERYRRIAPLLGRLEKLFLGKPLVRNVVGQRKSSIDFRRVIAEKQIILVPLPLKKLGEDARVVGLLLIAQLHAAIFSQADIPEAQRTPFSLYIDEFQNFMTRNIEELVTEGRKYKIRLVVAHQVRSKLREFLLEPTMAMRTKIVMRTTIEDAKEMAPYFPVGGERVSEVETESCKSLLLQPPDDPLVRTFIDVYLRPLRHQPHSHNQVEMLGARDLHVWDAFIPGAMPADGKLPEVYRPDPTSYLDVLFYDVMRERNWLLPIPLNAIQGFANCGGGFFHALKWISDQDLSGNVSFPDHLANQTARGYVWVRRPESEREQFLHCVFHLRMVMKYLAEHPLGKIEKPSTAGAAQLLIQLPPRAACVKYLDGSGVIYTHHTPKLLTGEALAARKFFVREQTRQTYCHKREDVEHRVVSDETTDPHSFSRWTEVTDDPAVSGDPDLRPAAPGQPPDPSGLVPAAPADR